MRPHPCDTASLKVPMHLMLSPRSCWAFSSVETIESRFAIATGEIAPVLSEQQIISCAANPRKCGGSGGCDGATQPLAFNYTMSTGLTSEADYPYKGVTGSCSMERLKPIVFNTGFVSLPVNNYSGDSPTHGRWGMHVERWIHVICAPDHRHRCGLRAT